MKIYIDNDCKCHVSNDGTMREFDVPFFDGKCPVFVEGYRYVPLGETWTRSGGEAFKGEMISPCRDLALLNEFQEQYEVQQQTINEYEATLTEIETALGVTSE